MHWHPLVCCLLVVVTFAPPVYAQQNPLNLDEALTLALEDLASIEPQVRVQGANSLGKLGRKALPAAPQLTAALQAENEVVIAALNALSRIADEDPQLTHTLEPILPAVVERLGDADSLLAFEAARLLGYMKHRLSPLAPRLRLALERTPSRVICNEITELLSGMGEVGLAELIRATSSQDPAVRRWASWRIAGVKWQTEAAPGMLAGVVRWNNDPLARQAALQALSRIGPKAQIALHDIARAAADPQLSAHAMHAMLHITGEPKLLVPVLLATYYHSRDVEARFRAILMLGRLPRHPGVRAALIDAIWDEHSWAIRLAAIEGLQHCPDAAIWSPRLLAIFEQEGEEWHLMQVAAAASLAAAGHRTEVMVPFLLQVIADFDEQATHDYPSCGNWTFRPELVAARALGRLDPRSQPARRAIAALETALAREGGIDASALRAEAAIALFYLDSSHLARGALLRDLLAHRGPFWAFSDARDRIRHTLVHCGIDTDLTVFTFIETLEGDSADEAAEAAEDLARMGSAAHAALPALEDRLRSAHPELRTAAAAAIAQIQGTPITDLP